MNSAAPPWDQVHLRSVGVDIGSATSHVVFSEITMAKIGERFMPVERRVTHLSPILLTPYDSGNAIDVDTLLDFIDRQFDTVGLRLEEIDCGAVILTGTALDRVNARLAADLFAAQSGRFVTVAAGDALEATLAAHGAGAVTASLTAGTVLNIDIGGGTTKFALCRDGRVVTTSAIDVGARLIAADETGVITRLEPAGAHAAARSNVHVAVGSQLTSDQVAILAEYLVDQVWAAAGLGERSRLDPALCRTPPLPNDVPVDAIVVSGGVAEFLAGGMAPRGTRPFGDLGAAIAAEMTKYLSSLAGTAVLSSFGIRSTVLGAALFTVQVSGDTVHLADRRVLPLRDVPVAAVVQTSIGGERDMASTIAAGVERMALSTRGGALAIAVRWEGSATAERLGAVAEGLAAGVSSLTGWTGPLVLVCDEDVARLLGRRVERALPTVNVISLDGIDVRDLDFIDVAVPLDGTSALPVTVKSLLFDESR